MLLQPTQNERIRLVLLFLAVNEQLRKSQEIIFGRSRLPLKSKFYAFALSLGFKRNESTQNLTKAAVQPFQYFLVAFIRIYRFL